jgi:hypothetical protein
MEHVETVSQDVLARRPSTVWCQTQFPERCFYAPHMARSANVRKDELLTERIAFACASTVIGFAAQWTTVPG